MLADAIDAQCTQHKEPGDHDRPEQNADARRAVTLDQKQRDQHHQRQRHDPMVDTFERQPQAFNRRQYGDRRGDHAVAIEQCRADQSADHQQHAQFGMPRRRPPGQCGQGHDPAFALVVGAQHEHHVLDRDDPDQRPENERKNPQHPVMVDRHAIASGKHFFEGVQRTGADIAINHPDCRDQHADRLDRRMLGTCSLTTCLTHPPLLILRPGLL
ncbi:hypothetical protein D3C84_787800 [compost metagenome]